MPILVYFFLFTKISIRKIFLLLFSTFLVAFLYLFTRYLRWIDGVENFDISNFSLHEMLGDDSSELELIGILYKVIYYDEYHYLVSESFLTIKRILFFWVPDFIYEKPRDLSYVLWDYQTGVLGVSGSYHPTIVAEAYFNDKYLGVFIYPIFISVCFSMIDFFVKKDKSFLIYIMGPLCFFITALSRGSSYNAFLVLIISIVFFIFIKRVFGKK